MVAAAIAVPLFKRLGLGVVLGYLFAGVVVGPGVANVIGHVDEVLHIAELGVVFFLFLVGLELQPARLWELRKSVFGLGNAQVIGTTLVLAVVGLAFGLPLAAAVVAAMGLSLSSTAIALRVLDDRGLSRGPTGQAGFGILLFQDLAVVPLLALIPILAGQSSGGVAEALVGALKVGGMVVAFLVGGRLVIGRLFRAIVAIHVHEISTVVALLIVVGAGLAMSAVGMSMALGAFLAGVLLAESEYRHELEAAIEPFKGLLLGLFFMAIGMSANLDVLRERPLAVLVIVVVVVVVKTLVFLGLFARLDSPLADRAAAAAALSQGGEFAFVLYGIAADQHVLDPGTRDLLVLVVSMSMATTPLIVPAAVWLARRLRPPPESENRPFDTIDQEAPIIIAGFGRFGQIVGRALISSGYRFTALEHDVDHVDFVRRYGNKLFYGDATHLDLLRAAGIERARALVIAVDDVETSLKIATIARTSWPSLPLYARVRNRQHAYRMMALGVTLIERETLHSSLRLAERLITHLEGDPRRAKELVDAFERWDDDLLQRTYLVSHDEQAVMQSARQAAAELGEIFQVEARRRKEQSAPPATTAATTTTTTTAATTTPPPAAATTEAPATTTEAAATPAPEPGTTTAASSASPARSPDSQRR
jgi:glutathione-regulated potassium-efflux system ancillary protein KefC/glutathione-regulated potassium-efflux system protein KefB